jgi:CRP/FNR family cyclic AMP-dependent transcriptional regulator
MSESLKILRPGEVIFRAGDRSDGMYLIRKGRVLVFLDRPGGEFPLAIASAGGIVGEMALIDKKPRSASARALEQVELTHISNHDFARILQQIPKWFVSLLTSLSIRLRESNTHLQKVESQYSITPHPLESLPKVLKFVLLLWTQIGTKDAKNSTCSRSLFESELALILSWDAERVTLVTDALISSSLLSAVSDQSQLTCLSLADKSEFERFIHFVSSIRRTCHHKPLLISELTTIVDVLARLSHESIYDTFSITLSDLSKHAQKQGFRTGGWQDCAELLSDLDAALMISRMGREVVFRIQTQKIDRLLVSFKSLRAMCQESLSQSAGLTAT